MDKVRTATGKTFDSDYIATIPSPARAFIRIANEPLATVASVFGDRNETVSIQHGAHLLTRYTRLVAIIPEMDAVKVVLDKE